MKFSLVKLTKQKGLAQIPIILGLLLMAIAIPIATKLSQESAENRGRAAYSCPPTAYSGGSVCCNGQQYAWASNHYTMVQSCPVGCDGDSCKASCVYKIDNCGACGEGACGDGQKMCDEQHNDCSVTENKCFNMPGQCAATATATPRPTAQPDGNCGTHANYSSWCEDGDKKYCTNGTTYTQTCGYGCTNGSCKPVPTTAQICTAGAVRCVDSANNGNGAQEKCNGGGTAWDFVMNCVTGCNGKLCDTYVTNTPVPSCDAGATCKPYPAGTNATSCDYYSMDNAGGSCNGMCCRARAPTPTPIKKYRCTQTNTCVEDPNGSFTGLSSCQTVCVGTSPVPTSATPPLTDCTKSGVTCGDYGQPRCTSCCGSSTTRAMFVGAKCCSNDNDEVDDPSLCCSDDYMRTGNNTWKCGVSSMNPQCELDDGFCTGVLNGCGDTHNTASVFYAGGCGLGKKCCLPVDPPACFADGTRGLFSINCCSGLEKCLVGGSGSPPIYECKSSCEVTPTPIKKCSGGNDECAGIVTIVDTTKWRKTGETCEFRSVGFGVVSHGVCWEPKNPGDSLKKCSGDNDECASSVAIVDTNLWKATGEVCEFITVGGFIGNGKCWEAKEDLTQKETKCCCGFDRVTNEDICRWDSVPVSGGCEALGTTGYKTSPDSSCSGAKPTIQPTASPTASMINCDFPGDTCCGLGVAGVIPSCESNLSCKSSKCCAKDGATVYGFGSSDCCSGKAYFDGSRGSYYICGTSPEPNVTLAPTPTLVDRCYCSSLCQYASSDKCVMFPEPVTINGRAYRFPCPGKCTGGNELPTPIPTQGITGSNCGNLDAYCCNPSTQYGKLCNPGLNCRNSGANVNPNDSMTIMSRCCYPDGTKNVSSVLHCCSNNIFNGECVPKPVDPENDGCGPGAECKKSWACDASMRTTISCGALADEKCCMNPVTPEEENQPGCYCENGDLSQCELFSGRPSRLHLLVNAQYCQGQPTPTGFSWITGTPTPPKLTPTGAPPTPPEPTAPPQPTAEPGVTGTPGGSCDYGSLQAQVQPDTSQDWRDQMAVKTGDTINLGCMHDGSGELANNVKIVAMHSDESQEVFDTKLKQDWEISKTSGAYTIYCESKAPECDGLQSDTNATLNVGGNCIECPGTFRCYGPPRDQIDYGYRWFVDGYQMEGYVDEVPESYCTDSGILKPDWIGKGSGDANCNGEVDNADYSHWRTEFVDESDGEEVVRDNWEADFTGPQGVCDGVVDGADYSLWRTNYIIVQGVENE